MKMQKLARGCCCTACAPRLLAPTTGVCHASCACVEEFSLFCDCCLCCRIIYRQGCIGSFAVGALWDALGAGARVVLSVGEGGGRGGDATVTIRRREGSERRARGRARRERCVDTQGAKRESARAMKGAAVSLHCTRAVFLRCASPSLHAPCSLPPTLAPPHADGISRSIHTDHRRQRQRGKVPLASPEPCVNTQDRQCAVSASRLRPLRVAEYHEL
eukprot:scaffold12848_cov140-Isochrysis_galbana.AAC.5